MKGLRTTDEGTVIPYRDKGVTFVQWRPDRSIDVTNEIRVKREWLDEPLPLFAAWNGTRRTDVFAVDLAAAREALA